MCKNINTTKKNIIIFGIIIFPVLAISAISFSSFQRVKINIESIPTHSPFPQVKITNGLIYVRIYLPDADSGYYRSTRFDWSGVMPDIEYKGHTFCGQWFDKYAPTINDAIMGPVECFAPLGYNDAKLGDSFTQIGVGFLARPTDTSYSPFHYYKILDPGKWTIKGEADEVEFLHTLVGNKYPYEYRKRIKLIKGKSEMVITHSLKNIGHQTIETEVYDHNLFLIDNQLTGPDVAIKFPFNLTAEKKGRRGIGEIAEIADNRITFLRKLFKNEQVYSVLNGYDNSPRDYDIRVENHKTGAGIRIKGNRPLSRLIFWASSKISCPEPYIHIKISPSEVFSWRISYKFYIQDTLNYPKDTIK